jgi:hypothetical protein
VKTIAHLSLAAAVSLFATASSFGWCHHHCGRVVYAPVATGGTAGAGFNITPANSFNITPAAGFGFNVMPAASFAGFQAVPASGMQMSFSLPVTFTGQQNPQGGAGLPNQQMGFGPVTGPGTTTPTPTGCVTEAQVRALLESRLATTEANVHKQLQEIYTLLALVAKSAKVEVPAPKNFTLSSPSPASQANMDETQRLLAQIETKQAAWKASTMTPAEQQVDRQTTETQRLLAEIAAKQAAWKAPANATVTVSAK